MGNNAFNPFDPSQMAAFQQQQVSNQNPAPAVPSADTLGNFSGVPAPPSPTPAPSPQPQQQTRGGAIKQFLTGYLGNIASQLEGMPSPYEQEQIKLKNFLALQQAQNQTTTAQSALAERMAQAEYFKGRNLVAAQNSRNQLAGALAKVGLVPTYDENSGEFGVRQMTPDEMSPVLQAQIDRQNAMGEYQRAAAAYQQAHAQTLTNPNNPAYQQKERQIQAQLAMARQRLQITIEGNSRQNAQFGINNGVMPDGSQPTVVGNGQLVGDNGQIIGKNFQTFNEPTGATRTAGEQGQIINQAGAALKADIDAHRNKLGNVSAIVNSAFLGTPIADPDSARIAASLASYAALNPRLHGFRGSQALAEFKHIVGGLPNNPDALKAAIDGIGGTAGIVAHQGTPRTTANTGFSQPNVPPASNDPFAAFGGRKR